MSLTNAFDSILLMNTPPQHPTMDVVGCGLDMARDDVYLDIENPVRELAQCASRHDFDSAPYRCFLGDMIEAYDRLEDTDLCAVSSLLFLQQLIDTIRKLNVEIALRLQQPLYIPPPPP